MSRTYSRADRLVAILDEGLRVLATRPRAARPSPADSLDEAPMTASERAHSAELMRVNRAGEIAAQALYRGQALTAGDAATVEHLSAAAREESDHLAWCTDRIRELGGRPSLLDPAWYFGSAIIGVAAGLSGDSRSLGFIAETERQVESHINDHLDRLPEADAKSRAILTQMRADEARHGDDALAAGGSGLPERVRSLMAVGGEILRRLALRV